MPPMTFPNQRVVRIHRESVKSDFLGIKNENWQAASRDLGAHGLRLYLYLASNANNYNLALSPAAARAAIGIPRSTYFDQFAILVDKGYLVPVNQKQTLFIFRDKANSSIEIKDKAFGSIEQEQEQDKKIEFKKSDNGFVF